MTYIITENCIKCKYTDCVSVCPVDCFNEGENFLVINEELCIDCAICVPECPADAIYSDLDLKKNQKIFLKINSELSKIWPNIKKIKINKNIKKWINIKNKLHLLKF